MADQTARPLKTASAADRRAWPRAEIRRDGKLLWHGCGRAVPARTIDLSLGGALVELAGPHRPRPGQRVEIVVVSSGEVLVPRAELRRATVVRVDEARGDVAVRFDEPSAAPSVLAA